MKKILAISALAALLAACSGPSSNDRPQGQPPQGNNAQLEQAMQECHASTGTAKAEKPSSTSAKKAAKPQDNSKFEACMKAKGFEKPSDNGQGPQGQPPKAQ